MIAANELRIGNLAYNQYGKIGTVWGFKVGDATHDFEHIVSFKELNVNSCYSRYIKPIPLTPEILEKCGLKRHSYEMSGCEVWYLQDTSWRVARSYRDGNEYRLWHERISPPTWNLKTFAYLHELQNIIFALTGEELNYTP